MTNKLFGLHRILAAIESSLRQKRSLDLIVQSFMTIDDLFSAVSTLSFGRRASIRMLLQKFTNITHSDTELSLVRSEICSPCVRA